MKTERPVNLDITSMKFPITAIVSIFHRLTGLLLFFFIPFILWLTWYSLSSEARFNTLKHYMDFFWLRLVAWVFISALFYHLVAGVRHLLMDLHIGESLKGGRMGAWLILCINVIVIVLLGIYILVGFNHVIW